MDGSGATLRRLLSYSTTLYAIALLTSLVRVGLRALIAKNAGMEALGAYAFYGTAIALGGSIFAFGLKRSVAKFVAASGRGSDFAGVVCAVMAIFAAGSLVLAFAGLAVAPLLDWVFLLVLVSIGPVTLFEIARAAFRGQLDQGSEARLLLGGIAVQALCVVVATLFARGPLAPVWGIATANLLIALAVVASFIRRHPAQWRPSGLRGTLRSTAFRGVVALSLPIWISDIMGVLGHQADQFILQGSLGYSALAMYAAAFTFVGLLDLPLTIMSRIALVAYSGDGDAGTAAYRSVISLNLAAFSLAGLATTALSIPLAPVIFTSEYTLVPTLVAILTIACIFNAADALNSSLTIARDFATTNRDASLWSTAGYVPVALLLVWQVGVIGAAWSYVASWSGYVLVHAVLMRRRLPRQASVTLGLVPASAALYGITAAAICWSGTAWSLAVSAPALLAVGQLLGLWDLREVVPLARRALAHGDARQEGEGNP